MAPKAPRSRLPARRSVDPLQQDRKLMRIGLLGAGVVALCCFTPVLVALLAALGLSAIVGHLDHVLFPALAVFGAIAIYGFARRCRRPGQAEVEPGAKRDD